MIYSLEVNFNAYPIINGKEMLDAKHKVFNPSDLSQCIGEVAFSSKSTIEQSIDTASLYFPVWKNFNIDKVRDGLNHHLRPNPIAILKVENASDSFHARFSAKQRTYEYLITNRRAPLTIKKNKTPNQQ